MSGAAVLVRRRAKDEIDLVKDALTLPRIEKNSVLSLVLQLSNSLISISVRLVWPYDCLDKAQFLVTIADITSTYIIPSSSSMHEAAICSSMYHYLCAVLGQWLDGRGTEVVN